MKILKQYSFVVILLAVMLGLYWFQPGNGLKAVQISLSNTREMLTFLPPIFILVGLLDVWVPKDAMIKLMGHGSGLKGIFIAFALGTAAAGPLYAAFPVAALLLKKGARLAYVIFFLGVWSSTKLPLLLYEVASLGLPFTAIHVGVSIPSFLLIAYFIEKVTAGETQAAIYDKANTL